MDSKKYDFKESEKKWMKKWDKEGTYKFNPKSKSKPYTVDTPPPTLSGKMHLGHAFSYSQQDFVVRYHRMKGENVFYPFGTDDNGLPTEKLVEKLKKVKSTRMERQDFVDLCNKTLKELRPEFIQSWKNIGISCDWESIYSTIDPHCIKTSQKSFIDLYKKKLVYMHTAPVMWCVSCQTAIAQAELDDKEQDSSFNDINFELEDGRSLSIATTRPELLPACVAIFVHPDDKRYTKIVGKKVKVPLFGQEILVYKDKSVNPEKGTGVLMICSYGDKYDVEAIKKKKLEAQICITNNGRMNQKAGEFEGLTIKEARKAILEKLEDKKYLTNKKPIKNSVNVHERCQTEIEFLTTKQWFIKVLDHKKELLDAGKKIKWYPEHMKKRYDHWIKGLQWDWCISRQRHYGVSFPLWHCQDCGDIVLAEEKQLPMDPLEVKPLSKCTCGSKNLKGEEDVMDTWATSSCTPQIALNWVEDKGYGPEFKKMYPMSLRPQAHDIIRTWAFYTIVKGMYHHKKIPWNSIVISGHITDSKGRKMSKSLGNIIEPAVVLDKFGADVWRFLAAGSKLGEDLPFQEKDLLTGKKTVTKLWNASKFSFSFLEGYKVKKVELEEMDKWLLSELQGLVKTCTDSFEEYEYSKAKVAVENFFWHTFCDNYLEIVKDRLYNEDKRGKRAKQSGQYTLYVALETILKLFAPLMPFITEEIYNAYYKKGSIHISKWPAYDKSLENKKINEMGKLAVEVISQVRQEKTKKQKSLKEPVRKLIVASKLKGIEEDLKAVTRAETIEYGKTFSIDL